MVTTTTRAESGLRLRVERRGGRSVLARAEGHVPLAARQTAAPDGRCSVVLVQTVGGPLGGDRWPVEVEVGPGAALEVSGNGATVALPGAGPARLDVRCSLGVGSRLAWLPEPVIPVRGCEVEASVVLELAAGAAAVVRETVVLGRHGEPPGRYRGVLRCVLAGRPLLHDATVIDPDGPTTRSPAVLGAARVCATLALLGLEPEPAHPHELALAGPGRLVRVAAADAATAEAALAPVLAAWLDELHRP